VLLAAAFYNAASETSNNASNMVGCLTCKSFDLVAKFLGATPSERTPMGLFTYIADSEDVPFQI
jgi:hypothetical protein